MYYVRPVSKSRQQGVTRGGWFEDGAARRLYLGHPGRHSPRSIAVPARAVLPLARTAADYLTRLAHCPTDINYFINHLLYEITLVLNSYSIYLTYYVENDYVRLF